MKTEQLSVIIEGSNLSKERDEGDMGDRGTAMEPKIKGEYRNFGRFWIIENHTKERLRSLGIIE